MLYRQPADSVKLLAASKQQDAATVRQAYAAGIRDYGENYLQEALCKIEALADLDICWHFIGPIQTNKTSGIASHFDWVHSVSRLKVAQRLSKHRPAQLTPLNVCVQINLSAETTKAGVSLTAAEALCDEIQQLPRLQLRGLMSIPAPVNDILAQRQNFHPLAALYRRLQQRYSHFDTLSMGMSGDYEAAIAEGSTLIRIGSDLFGKRS